MTAIPALINKYKESYRKFSLREKALIWGGILVLLPLIGNQFVVKPIREQILAQSQSLDQLRQDLLTVPHILDRYLQVAAKKKRD